MGVGDRPDVVATIGVFDGVHLGHQALVRQVLRRAEALGAHGICVTFSPHPEDVLRPESEIVHLASLADRAAFLEALLEEAGIAAGEAIMIGDSHNDTLTAKNAGLWSIGCTYGLSPQSLEQVPPDILIDSPLELVEALGFGEVRRSSEVPSRERFSG